MALGNNKESVIIRKISIPFFDELGNTPNGQRFFFPEHPEIDNKTIVGIEAHLQQTPPAIVLHIFTLLSANHLREYSVLCNQLQARFQYKLQSLA